MGVRALDHHPGHGLSARAHEAPARRIELKMTVIGNEAQAAGHDCRSCGSHSVTVGEVLAVQESDDVLALWEALRWRPHRTPDGCVALVDIIGQRALFTWTTAEAEELLYGVLLPGPYGAELVLEVDGCEELSFKGGELIALAAGLVAILQSLYR